MDKEPPAASHEESDDDVCDEEELDDGMEGEAFKHPTVEEHQDFR